MAKNKRNWFYFMDGFERKSQPLAPRKLFLSRLYRNIRIAAVLLAACLLLGIIGYKFGGPMSWIDALHNASMILSGMGPVVTINTIGGKIFSSFYALFSGIAFITNIGILIAPVAHRFFHKMHAEEKSEEA